MRRKKSSFLTFISSLIPGAGEMYLGFMKRGLSIMTLFCVIIFFSVWLNIGSLLFALPVIWFYSFFEVHNLRSMPDDKFYMIEDDYIFIPDVNKDKLKAWQNKYRNLLALVLIIIGITVLWNNMYSLVEQLLPSYVSVLMYYLGHYVPQMILGCAIIVLGLYLIRGKKKELDMSEKTNLIEDKGGKAV